MSEPMLPLGPDIADLHYRTYRGESDLPAIVELLQAARRANGEEHGISEEQLAVHFRNQPRVDPAADMVLAFVGDRLVARSFIDWARANDGCWQYQSWGDVHPDWRRRGIGGALWRRNIERLTSLAAEHDHPGERALVVPYLAEGDVGGAVLAGRLGYRRTRMYRHMTRPDLESIVVPPVPEGLRIRPITAALLRTVFDGGVEAFRDHYGVFDASESSYRQWIESPTTDPNLIVAAFDGQAIAGAVHGEIHVDENEQHGYQRGWTDPVWVRRPWRRRGLASALLGRALVRLRESGMTSAQLDVDSDNPNRALTLYQRHGFVADRAVAEWSMPLAPAV